MSDDLVKRLRDPAFGTETTERLLMEAAATEVLRLREAEATLRAEVERLREALRFYAPLVTEYGIRFECGDDGGQRAAAALGDKEASHE
jgi:hypothetical protein